MSNAKPYFETVRDVYVRAAADLYHAAIAADFETADPVQFIARADEMRNQARETWAMTTRAERRLAGLRARAELNTQAGLDHKQRMIEALTHLENRLEEIEAETDSED